VTVLQTQPAAGVTVLTLNRPNSLNALDGQLISDLHRQLRAVRNDDDCRVVVLTGVGRSFCAGLDVQYYTERCRPDWTWRTAARLSPP
jgi:enoyl-CoA hydratase